MSDSPTPRAAVPNGGQPVHVAIIMDGNGRWAKARGLPRIAGHRRGAEAVRKTIRAASELGIRYLTLFGFSSENWKRPIEEVDDLMGLLRHYLRGEIAELHRNHVVFRVIGDRGRLSPDIVALIESAENTTRDNSGLNVVVALSYGSRAEIVTAVRSLAKRVADGKIQPEEIEETMLGGALWTSGIPDPDLIIRSSGEKRLSNFLLWQAAYAEFVFVDTLWPDFGKEELAAAVGEFQRRDRRYGAAGG